jgi:hypothetical protein
MRYQMSNAPHIPVKYIGLNNFRHGGKTPAGLIVTGPNIASQELLFGQLATHLRSVTGDIVVILRSGDAPNLKTVLKKLIRDATSQRSDLDDNDDDEQTLQQKDVGFASICKYIQF